MSDIAQEKNIPKRHPDQMLSHGWLLGESSKYNKELALYPEDVIAFVKAQLEQWDKLPQHFPNTTAEALLKSLEQELKRRHTLGIAK